MSESTTAPSGMRASASRAPSACRLSVYVTGSVRRHSGNCVVATSAKRTAMLAIQGAVAFMRGEETSASTSARKTIGMRTAE